MALGRTKQHNENQSYKDEAKHSDCQSRTENSQNPPI